MNNLVSRKPQRWSHSVGSSAEVARFSDLSAISAVLASWASGSGHQHEGGLVKRSPTTGRGLSVMAFGYAARPNRREDTRRQPCVARPLTAGPKAPLCPIGGGRGPHPPTSRTGRRDVPMSEPVSLPPKWYTVAQVAQLLGYGESKVRMLIIAGELHS